MHYGTRHVIAAKIIIFKRVRGARKISYLFDCSGRYARDFRSAQFSLVHHKGRSLCAEIYHARAAYGAGLETASWGPSFGPGTASCCQPSSSHASETIMYNFDKLREAHMCVNVSVCVRDSISVCVCVCVRVSYYLS